jgi:hypothetical protein
MRPNVALNLSVLAGRQSGLATDGTYTVSGTLCGPKIGPKGPTQFLVGAWNQNPVGYCYETNSFTEDLYAKWKARGCNTIKAQHPDFPAEGNATALLAAVKAKDLMLIAAPRWQQGVFGTRADPDALDYRNLAVNDPYWRINWLGYAVLDEIDLSVTPFADHVSFLTGHALSGVTKPGVLTLTRRASWPALGAGVGGFYWRDAVQMTGLSGIGQDSYLWHLSEADGNVTTAVREIPHPTASSWNAYGPLVNTIPPENISLINVNRVAKGRRFTANVAELSTYLFRNGPFTKGYSANGLTPPILPPDTSSITTLMIEPSVLDYAPGDRWTYGYVSTGRLGVGGEQYPRGGQHQPGRYLRDEAWSIIFPGGAGIFAFPNALGSATVQGYVDAGTQRLTITTPETIPAGASGRIRGAIRVFTAGFSPVGFIRRDNPQISGTPGREGVYALDTTKVTTVTTGSAGTPVSLVLLPAGGPADDDTNAENAAEFKAMADNIARMQAHPTGGNLLMDTGNGGRRAFTYLPCPDISDDSARYKNDMTLAPIASTALDAAGQGPGWATGWPMGFRGFHVTGADGAVYIYVQSMSNGDNPTWFPGYAALGLPERAFGPFELVGFRRVGTASAVEMTGTSGVIKAAVDDGPATWVWLDQTPNSVTEGNSGTATLTATVRRDGNVSGTTTVPWSVAGFGYPSANAADFGGTFPSGTVTFNAGEKVKTIAISVSGDTTSELSEQAALTLGTPTGGVLVGSNRNRLVFTMTNDDAPAVGAFIWLVDAATSAPSLSGSPAGATYLKISETSNVTRAGITMRSRNGGANAYDASGSMFAAVPAWRTGGAFDGVDLLLAAGNWQIAPLLTSFGYGGGINGNLLLVNDPAGAATVLHNITFDSTADKLLMTVDGVEYTNEPTAVAEAVNGLASLSVTVTDLGGGVGRLRIRGGGSPDALYIAAVGVLQA